MKGIEYVGKCLLIKERGERILVVGDLHLGYEESLNRTGVYVSREMFKEMIKYLDGVFAKIGEVDRVVLLGDVKHVFGGVLRDEWNGVLGLFEYLEEKCEEILIVKGNHDGVLEPIIRGKSKVRLLDYYIWGEYCFVHGDKKFGGMEKSKVWVMGHAHPAVKISDGVKVEKYKCFLVGRWKRKDVVVVPSFFEGNEGSDPRENDLGLAWDLNLKRFNVRIVGENLEVLDFGELGKLN